MAHLTLVTLIRQTPGFLKALPHFTMDGSPEQGCRFWGPEITALSLWVPQDSRWQSFTSFLQFPDWRLQRQLRSLFLRLPAHWAPV